MFIKNFIIEVMIQIFLAKIALLLFFTIYNIALQT